MDVQRFLDRLRNDRSYKGQIVHVESIPARPARFGKLVTPLHPAVQRILAAQGIERLYTHQVSAVELARQGKDFVVVTSTASGKTLCYNIPVLETLARDPAAKAIYLFPTKALAQDKMRGLARFKEAAPEFPLVAGVYDGDTSPDTRRKLREEANVILTNPDMLHQGILPWHPSWSRFFANLRYVVIDEVHAYRGIFGSNVGAVLRRLERIARHYGAKPQIICASATIANPKELSEKLTGRTMEVVDDDGSPKGPRKFVLWNPPFIDEGRVERRSSNAEAEHLLVELMKDGAQVIAFAKARVVAEVLYRYVRERLEREAPRLADKIRAYRGGYLPEDRRAIERALFSGELMAVTSTNALELGIDIGSLDAAVIVGYPGTIASTWQQAGRAGRKGDEALAVLIAHNLPVDQYLMRHPEYLFGKSPENAVIDPHNPYVLARHLRCAAYEIPIRPEDAELFGDYTQAVLEVLEDSGELIRRGQRWHWARPVFPAGEVKLRNMSDNTYTIVDTTAYGTRGGAAADVRADRRPAFQGRGSCQNTNRVIGTIDELSAFEQVHPEAVYMHDGETYLVESLDLSERVAYVHKADVDYFTQAISETRVQIEATEEEKRWRAAIVGFGDLSVTSLVYMFKKVKFYSRDSIGYGKVDLPPRTMDTTGFWLIPPLETLSKVRSYGRIPSEGLLGIGNVLSGVLSMFVMCDPTDVGTVVESSNIGAPTLIVYDRYPGGVGFAQRGYELVGDLMTACLSVVEECRCEDGCPSCVGAPVPPYAQQDPDASTRGRIPDKEAALVILYDLLGKGEYVPKRPPRDVRAYAEAGWEYGEAAGGFAVRAGMPEPRSEARRNGHGGGREADDGPGLTWDQVPRRPLPLNVERRIREQLSSLGAARRERAGGEGRG